MNCLSALQNSFNVELRKGVRARFNRGGRGKIISSVCHVNRAVFNFTRAVGKEKPWWTSPSLDTEEESIDPLRDKRVVEVLRKRDMEHCFVEIATWSFGQEGVKEHRLKNSCGMAMNSKGQFSITESNNGKVKVFDRRGKFIGYFSLPVHDVVYFKVFDVAVDTNDNFYVLAD